jgi:hypothetical protein
MVMAIAVMISTIQVPWLLSFCGAAWDKGKFLRAGGAR